MSEQPFKVHAGGERPRCPACRRKIGPAKHKTRPGGAWCSGKADPLRDRAIDLLARTHDAAAGMCVLGDYKGTIALLSPIESQLPPRSM